MIEYFEKTISPLRLTFSLIACMIMSAGCGSSDNEGPLELRPVENKEYKYSLVKMSVRNWVYNGEPNSKSDTAALNFSMQKINNSDSPVIYKGDQNGYVVLSYSKGMPFMFETHSDVVTITDYYDSKVNEHLVVRLQ